MSDPRGEQEIQAWLQARLGRVRGLAPAALALDRPFAEMGIDSVEAVGVAVELEEWIGRTLPETLLWEYPTIAEIAHHLAQGAVPAAPIREVNVSEEHYVFEKLPAYAEMAARRAALTGAGLPNPYFREYAGRVAPTAEAAGRSLLSFCSYNYLGTAGDPIVTEAAIDAARRYGTTVSASRLVGGERPVHRELERAMAAFLGVEAALVFIGGHATNVSAIGSLMGPNDLIVYDQLAHDSMLQGCRLSHARLQPFPHDDWRTLDRILTERRRHFEKVLVVVEGFYSADGDPCTLPRFLEVKRKHHAWIFLDEAHSFGTIGDTGQGICEYWGVPVAEVDIWMTTLSKALGSAGGIIAGRQALVDLLRYGSSGFVNSVGIPATSAAAALAALQTVRREPERRQRLHQLAKRFDLRARDAGLDLGLSLPASPIKPVMVGDAHRCIALAHRLFERGLDAQPLIPPSVPPSRARLRFFLTSLHSEDQIDRAVDWTTEELARISAA
jgi:8-amino-7-oxononanoate synthase